MGFGSTIPQYPDGSSPGHGRTNASSPRDGHRRHHFQVEGSEGFGRMVPPALGDRHRGQGGLSLYAWVFSAFLIVQTVTIPIFGKLSDLYGRKRLFLLGVVVFMAGSVLSGASQSIVELILFRAVQGLGFGAFVPTTIAIAGDMFPPERWGRVQG